MTTPDVQTSTVATDDLSFTYLEVGEGPLALCLHGFPDCADGWRPLLRGLADAGFHAVAPYMRGYAPTEVPADRRYQSGVLAMDANALHAALGGDERAVIIGHDWGGFAAYGAPTLAPERWARVVAASIPPTALLGAQLMSYDLLKNNFWYQFVFCNPLADFVVAMNDLEFIERLWADWSPGFDAGTAVGRVKDALREPANLNAALGYYRQTLGALAADPALADAQNASMGVPDKPLLYLHGVDDGCMPPPTLDALHGVLTGAGSRAELVANAGHFLQYEQPELVTQLIVDFVTTH